MSVSLAALNAMPEAEAAERLRACCGSSAWVARMVHERPFGSMEHLLTAAESAWNATSPSDWEEAFAHHPRIGEHRAAAPVSAEAAAWSSMEQQLAARADAEDRDALARANAEYEDRFGRTYIVCATGLTAADILADVRRRLGNAPDAERRVAASEQAKITALRLRKLIGDQP